MAIELLFFGEGGHPNGPLAAAIPQLVFLRIGGNSQLRKIIKNAGLTIWWLDFWSRGFSSDMFAIGKCFLVRNAVDDLVSITFSNQPIIA